MPSGRPGQGIEVTIQYPAHYTKTLHLVPIHVVNIARCVDSNVTWPGAAGWNGCHRIYVPIRINSADSGIAYVYNIDISAVVNGQSSGGIEPRRTCLAIGKARCAISACEDMRDRVPLAVLEDYVLGCIADINVLAMVDANAGTVGESIDRKSIDLVESRTRIGSIRPCGYRIQPN